MWRCLRHKLTTNAITVLSSGRSLRQRGKEMERDTEGGRREGWVRKRSLSKKRSFLGACTALLCVFTGVYAEENFTVLPSLLSSIDVIASCSPGLSLFLLYLWKQTAVSAVWEWSGVSEIIGHSCPLSLSCAHISLGCIFCTMHKNTHLTLKWIHGLFFSPKDIMLHFIFL